MIEKQNQYLEAEKRVEDAKVSLVSTTRCQFFRRSSSHFRSILGLFFTEEPETHSTQGTLTVT